MAGREWVRFSRERVRRTGARRGMARLCWCAVGCVSWAACKPAPSTSPASASTSAAAAAPEAHEVQTARERHTYYTGGVHDESGCPTPASCTAPRTKADPSDPSYPEWWSSEWTMYRVYNQYEQYPPPYASPPAHLTEGSDYETSHGATYYDSTYVPADKDGTGAMMEYYDQRCLPIFPGDNHYTCAFISLGNKAYFLDYGQDPASKPSCCQFSLDNHPPRRDFIEHLPYSPERSEHLSSSLQAYATVVDPGILFGYAFYEAPTPDTFDHSAAAYRHPQSFYFSGYGDAANPPNAPIVSQNYEHFRMEKPKPEATWQRVANACPAEPEWCCLFPTDCSGQALQASPAAGAPKDTTWAEGRP
jgi:hypothetical protein